MYVRNSLARDAARKLLLLRHCDVFSSHPHYYINPDFFSRLFQDVEDTSARGCDDFIRPKEVSATYGQSVFFSSYFDLPQVEEVSKFTWSKRNKDNGRSQLILRSDIGNLVNRWMFEGVAVTCWVGDLLRVDSIWAIFRVVVGFFLRNFNAEVFLWIIQIFLFMDKTIY